MGTANVCNRCGNAYAGAFDNEFFCEHCKHDNTQDQSSVKVLLKAVPALVLLVGVLWTAVWLLGKFN